MRKWAVIYSSTTGNTKAIAEEIAGASGGDIFRVQDAPTDLSVYDVVALGYWLRRGGPDDLMKAYLPKVNDACVILFQTHGADVGSEHAVTSFARAAYLLGEDTEILGTFSAQGKPSSHAAGSPTPTTRTTAPRRRSVGYAPRTIRTRRIVPPHANSCTRWSTNLTSSRNSAVHRR